MKTKKKRGEQIMYIGIMSGTSLDGIDMVAASFSDQSATLHHQAEYPFPEKLKDKLIALSQGASVTLEEIGTIDHFLGKTYAEAVNRFLAESTLKAEEIAAIGCHGQTVFHKPTGPMPFTMQLGDANIIAALTGITTVADFRRKDMALGGQGAPLVPAFHQFLFSTDSTTKVVLNIGGIANISVLAPDQPVIGYDTGPGNMLMDSWVSKHHGKPYDKDGVWAASGVVNQALLTQMLSDGYFAQSTPKSTGRELFNQRWLETHLNTFSQPVNAEDIQATLLAFTAQSIANDVTLYGSGELLVCGGGARNKTLMTALQLALPCWQVMPTDDIGINGDSLEALAFAWLAYQALKGKPGNLTDVTGASRPCRLGAIYYPD
ncbi:anhydro-N-acetylmuramic acid kinase [Grimontia sp. NTOU-MAR1]|uniref:anhydro-N-acetylmuramic acid kinase n=1 Tax=Grimontia sp. NTOU-MAR1 TaxID=3111011 RepID=UPI002DBABC7E|nr:anhydro-N-acetylmuramic acid kinase [Grimontia sp. NTOU-MAR1]WRW01085.1 anhydro-N-acetylmuramic acid kinase [Grimontia sp. NTOU-MAR1]